jgi:CRISPR/Cas system-associated exonuclease Cas4 (RecB family)
MSRSPSHRLVVSSHADQRTEAARAWLSERERGEEVVVVAAHADAASERVRDVAGEAGGAFGWQRTTLARLAGTLASPTLAERGRVPIGRLASEAVVARVLHELGERDALGRFADSGRGPGIVRAAASAIDELRGAHIEPASLAAEAPELVSMLEAYDAALEDSGLADRAAVEAFAVLAVLEGRTSGLVGLPLLLVDLPAPTASTRALLEALVSQSPLVLATLPTGDAGARSEFEALLGVEAEELTLPDAASALRAMQRHLFEESAPAAREPGAEVAMISAPGESRECVEIARRIQLAARDGVPFDRIAVLLRSPEAYAPFLVEALRRADVPAHFARDTRLPDPSGRAMLALLACAAEDLSARRFSEYLSLGEVPTRSADGQPPPAPPSAARWVPPDEDLVAERLATERAESAAEDSEDGMRPGGGSLPVPRRWERLLVDAAVIGGRARWERRLEGMAHAFERQIEEQDDPDAPVARRVRRDLADLAQLRAFALPLIDELARLPERADWGEWISALGALAARALRRPERVQSVLGELAPMARVGPVGLHEVQLVLTPRLQQIASPPSGARYGKVYVAPTDAARGLDFDLVFVPGLAEKLFPRKIGEDPILLDAVRERLGGGLVTNPGRLEAERLALRLAVGAASERVVLSFPRLDVDGGRPRVPSFYALETLRAAEGALPGFDELARRSEQLGEARLGWPAPEDASDAIDAAEYDLARLAALESADESQRIGTARYLLGANPHLGRALRFRARRWLDGWTVADGLVKPIPLARDALAAHALDARSYSPTALQNYAACPYKFYLYAIWRLSPREEPEAIEELDPLQRGSLVHEVQFELFGVLRDVGLLPVTPENLDTVWEHLDRVLAEVAARYEDDLAPAIERVWRDGVQSVRADLREWLRRASEDASGFVPWRFELSFGLPGRHDADPASSDAPVYLDAGLCLRGSIDLVERADDGRLRVTDHKTGKERFRTGGVVDGGRALQPVLYALAVERLFPDAQVESGRLYYCTSTGGFEEREVPLDDTAREAARLVAKSVGDAMEEPFLPAAPDKGACQWCDYRPVCGPYEELRTAKKYSPPLEPLRALRELP